MAGLLYVNGEKADKPGASVPEGAALEVRGKDHAYVSRGGLKLEKALACFPIELSGKICVDVGASTGGFTDCMLQNSAEKVYAVDVGYGQLAWSLRQDPRVVVMERCNIRHSKPEDFAEPPEFFSVDVSFISLKLVLPILSLITAENAEGVCLVKPQFEAGKDLVGKKGVVRDTSTHILVIEAAMGYAVNSGFSVSGLSYSPIKGPEGNIEFLMYLQKSQNPIRPGHDLSKTVAHEAAEMGG
jgi:23S rRNA (cytidine1920-2'-O)/16S rRNA (cytidine1409-2'-O)-methyltransferase